MTLRDTMGLYPPSNYPERGIKENEIWHSEQVRNLLQKMKTGMFYMAHEYATPYDKNRNYQLIQTTVSQIKVEIRDQVREHRAEYKAQQEEQSEIKVERIE